jgi:hypothetical protein
VVLPFIMLPRERTMGWNGRLLVEWCQIREAGAGIFAGEGDMCEIILGVG